MAEVRPLAPAPRIEWFVDAGDPDRRLRVALHPEEALAVISLWSARECRATFRLPIREADRMIGHLAAGMARGLPPPFAISGPAPRPQRPRLRDRIRGLLPPRSSAQVVPLRRS